MQTHEANTINLLDISEIFSGRNFSTMVKPVGARCNLNCTYCYYLKHNAEEANTLEASKPKARTLKNARMPEDLLEEYIRQYISSQESDQVTFCWHGGEPTTAGIQYFETAFALQKKHSLGKKIINTFQTNGTLIDRNWCRLFKENDILVGLSIDGPAHIHDTHRRWHRSSADAALKAALLFNETGVEFNTLTTVNNLSKGKGKEIYTYLRDVVGSRFMQFLPVAETANGVTPWSTTPEDYADFLTDIFDIWVRNDVGKVFVQTFEATLALWCGCPPGVCTFGEYCSDSLCVEHDGEVYPCDHFAYQEYSLGNLTQTPIEQIFASRKRIDFTLRKKMALPQKCHECKYLFACHGECPKHWFIRNADGSAENYLCRGLKNYFAHVEPYMDHMKKLIESEMPASMIMNTVRP